MLVVTQVAMALILLVSAVLMIRTFQARGAASVDPVEALRAEWQVSQQTI